MTDENWRLRASCRGLDPELWTLDRNRPVGGYKQAHAICKGCPVKVDCFELANRIGAAGMIFGGVDFPESRKAMVKTWTT